MESGDLQDLSAPPQSQDSVVIDEEGSGETGEEADFCWGAAARTSFRLLPEPSGHLQTFLNAEGLTQAEVLDRLPYHRERSGSKDAERPDPKRYRDPYLLYRTTGFLYEDGSDRRLRLTELGRTVREWLPILNSANAVMLGRHAAYALSSCQLRNPVSRTSRKVAAEVRIFPLSLIWRSMLALDFRIDSDELNRAVLRIRDEETFEYAIERIRAYRIGQRSDPDVLGRETIKGKSKNDRLIPWMSLASFGWVLIQDKLEGEAGYYEIRPQLTDAVAAAAEVRRVHREFADVPEYVEHLSRCAALPRDLR